MDEDISRSAALDILKRIGQADTAFSDLVKCGALKIEGDKVNLQHEALADYLRAKALLANDQQALRERVTNVALPPNSWFPILLMALSDSTELRGVLWQRFGHEDLITYLNVLRYRPDISEQASSTDVPQLSVQFLQELHDGVEGPMELILPKHWQGASHADCR